MFILLSRASYLKSIIKPVFLSHCCSDASTSDFVKFYDEINILKSM